MKSLKSSTTWVVMVAGVSLAGCGGAAESSGTEGANVDALTCGNGTRDADEQCDDGNKANLDGCSATCAFEQTQRMNSVSLQFATDAFCTSNALGKSIGGHAQGKLQDNLTGAVKDGSLSVLVTLLDAGDLTGQPASGLTVGSVFGKPVAGKGYNGAKDLDWWYTTDPNSIDANRRPKATLPASISGTTLSAGPGSLSLMLALGGAAVPLDMTDIRVQATVGATSAPTASKGSTPGHLASENIAPGLVSFGSLSAGEMCANITAASLAAVPAPAQLIDGGDSACNEGYSASNSLLDVFVHGCHILFFTIISGTQPDKFQGAAPPGGKYVFTTSDTKVTGCKDGTGKTASLDACLASGEYSSAFHFTSDRVILK